MQWLINLDLVMELYPRENELKNTFLFFILLCLCLIGLSRLMTPYLFRIVLKDFFSTKPYGDAYSDSNALSPAAHVLLSFNLFISTVICLISVLDHTSSMEEMVIQCILLVLSFFMVQQVGFRLVGGIVGSDLFVKNMGMITQQIWNFIGLIMLVLATLVLLNEEYRPGIKSLVYILLILLPLARIIKGLMYAKSYNYNWLYIILYLCTLEILPILIIGTYFKEIF